MPIDREEFAARVDQWKARKQDQATDGGITLPCERPADEHLKAEPKGDCPACGGKLGGPGRARRCYRCKPPKRGKALSPSGSAAERADAQEPIPGPRPDPVVEVNGEVIIDPIDGKSYLPVPDDPRPLQEPPEAVEMRPAPEEPRRPETAAQEAEGPVGWMPELMAMNAVAERIRGFDQATRRRMLRWVEDQLGGGD